MSNTNEVTITASGNTGTTGTSILGDVGAIMQTVVQLFNVYMQLFMQMYMLSMMFSMFRSMFQTLRPPAG